MPILNGGADMLVLFLFTIGIPLLLWLGVLSIILNRSKSGSKLRTRFRDIALWPKRLAVILLLLTLLVFVMGSQGFYLTFLKPAGSVVPVILIVTALCLFTSGMRLGLAMTGATIVLAVPAMAAALFSVAFMEYSYDTLTSPDQETKIVIEHRTATLGETNHFYTFYKKVPYLPVMKDLDQDASVMTRGVTLNSLQVLGADRPEWFDGSLSFRAITGEQFLVKWEKERPLN